MGWGINLFNKHSVFFTLSISFAISLFLVVFSYLLIVEKDARLYDKELKKRYFTVIQLIENEYQKVGFTQNLEDTVKSMGFEVVTNGKIDEVLRSNSIEPIFKRGFGLLFVYVLKGDKNNFIHIYAPFDEYLLIDKNVPKEEFKAIGFLIFLSVLFSFVFIYFTIYKKLYTLNELKEKIDHMDTKELKFENIDINKKDEVSLLAKKFKEKSDQIRNLKEARNIFIRNIMHELKTPITKGRFLTELEQNEQNNQKLKYVFIQLESLINELASIEEVIAKGEKIETKEYFFKDILENGVDKLILEDQNYSFLSEDRKINVNFKLFTTVVKNLIDNAVKYSHDNRVEIFIDENEIRFENKGKKLNYPLENYFEPFFNTDSKKNGSFGLGLYIVNSIVQAHKFKLGYEFLNGKNIFKIVLKP